MSSVVRITLYQDHRSVHSEEYSEPVELGRQDKEDGEVYQSSWRNDRWRIPIARREETTISKKQALVELLPQGGVRVSNTSTAVPFDLQSYGNELSPGSARELSLPVALLIGSRQVQIESVQLNSLDEAPQPPGAKEPDLSFLKTIAASDFSERESLIPWLQATMDVLQGTAAARDRFDRAAGALVEMIGLDAGRVMLLEGGVWRVQALRKAPPRTSSEPDNHPWKPSTRVLKRLQQEKRTFFWQARPSGQGSFGGLQTLVAAPILDSQGQVIGALYGERSEIESTGPWSSGPITRLQAMLVQLLASAVAAGLAQMKLVQIERDLEIGREIQKCFLPEELPQLPGWEIALYFEPAREVSGDFYDVFPVTGDHIALVIADVCDKGVGAALFMTLFRSLLRAFAKQATGHNPSVSREQPASAAGGRPRATLLADQIALSTVKRTNDYVARTHSSACMFASVLFGVLDAATGLLSYVNAGHDAPVVLGSAAVKTRLPQTGPVVGVNPDAVYDIQRVQLDPGEALFGYTDGVTEARSPAGAFFTEQRLLSLLESPVPSATLLLKRLIARLREHVAGSEPSDDVTMLALRRLPEQAKGGN